MLRTKPMWSCTGSKGVEVLFDLWEAFQILQVFFLIFHGFAFSKDFYFGICFFVLLLGQSMRNDLPGCKSP